MENLSFTPKGIRREAQGLLADNWSKALATLCLTLFALGAFFVFNRLVTTLIGYVDPESAALPEGGGFASLPELAQYYKSRGFRFSYIISLVLTAFFFMLYAPLGMGITKWYQSIVQCGDPKVGQVFHFYRNNRRFTDALSFEFSRLLRHLIVGGLCAAPSLVCFARALAAETSGTGDVSTMALLGAVLLLVGLAVYALVMVRWFAARYIFLAGIRKSVSLCFSASTDYMKGHTVKVLRVYISLLPLMLSCLLVAPAIYAVPIINASLAACAQDILDAVTPTA